MLVHVWAFEISEDCDMMRCGHIIHFGPGAEIIGDHDFVLGKGVATCDECLATTRKRRTAAVGRAV